MVYNVVIIVNVVVFFYLIDKVSDLKVVVD